ncbi:MAG: hypothetical protein BRD41_06595 [Bacteroidetes bacterium QS_1_63_11]|nr:MAG: hypothetical protein BRD41_06595 [Bacteroidetes bacterium QS_1_63_11]
MIDAAVDIQGVTHRYGEHRALRDVTLQVAPGTLYGLLGPNGSGKTTLFRILSTLMPPSEGHAEVFGEDTTQRPDAVRERIGVVFQDEALDEVLTVRENLRFQAGLYGLHGAARGERIEALLTRLGVADRADDPVKELSGGLRRRADLARGLLHRPDLLLLDEPTSALDPETRQAAIELLEEFLDTDTTVVGVFHNTEVVTAVADRVVELDEAQLQRIVPIEEYDREVVV